MGRAGGPESEIPEISGSAFPEGSTQGVSPRGMLHRWKPAFPNAGQTRVDGSGFVKAVRGAEEAPHKTH